MKQKNVKWEIKDLGRFVIIETNEFLGNNYFEVMDTRSNGLGIIDKQFSTREEAKAFIKELENKSFSI